MGLTALFGNIHELHCIISVNFYLYLQYSQKKNIFYNNAFWFFYFYFYFILYGVIICLIVEGTKIKFSLTIPRFRLR